MQASLSDSGVAAAAARAAAVGAYYNVLINLGEIDDSSSFAAETRQKAEKCLESVLKDSDALYVKIREKLTAKLEGNNS